MSNNFLPYQRSYQRQHYKNNKQKYVEKARRWRVALQQWIWAIKESKPCLDCKHYFPSYVMHFDHTEDNKEFNIANALTHVSKKKIEEEIAKCDLVCANCHAVRTFLRRQDALIVQRQNTQFVSEGSPFKSA